VQEKILQPVGVLVLHVKLDRNVIGLRDYVVLPTVLEKPAATMVVVEVAAIVQLAKLVTVIAVVCQIVLERHAEPLMDVAVIVQQALVQADKFAIGMGVVLQIVREKLAVGTGVVERVELAAQTKFVSGKPAHVALQIVPADNAEAMDAEVSADLVLPEIFVLLADNALRRNLPCP
jgi:hypothetical protein